MYGTNTNSYNNIMKLIFRRNKKLVYEKLQLKFLLSLLNKCVDFCLFYAKLKFNL